MITETYVEEMSRQADEIMGHWFKDHKAALNQYGEIVVLNWQEPGTGIFMVRYVCDRNNMYVSGDLGEAVFRFTEKAIPERIARYDLGYFCEKLRAFCDPIRDFNRLKAKEYVDEVLREHNEDGYEYDKSAFDELLGIIGDCESMEAYHAALFSFDYYRLGSDSWEWVSEIGSAIPMRLQSYLLGLKMAMSK